MSCPSPDGYTFTPPALRLSRVYYDLKYAWRFGSTCVYHESAAGFTNPGGQPGQPRSGWTKYAECSRMLPPVVEPLL